MYECVLITGGFDVLLQDAAGRSAWTTRCCAQNCDRRLAV